jgi:apoptosis-inducing factor 2
MYRVCVIGGGVAGIRAIKQLKKVPEIEITLIDPKSYHYNRVSSLRALVDTSYYPQTMYPYEDFLPEVKHILGEVKTLSNSTITLKNGDKISFDRCIIATGITYPAPQEGIGSEIVDQVHVLGGLQNNLQEAQHVVIAGGGATGIELAGEIRESYPTKSITIIQGASRLMPQFNLRASTALQTQLESLNIRVLCGRRSGAFDAKKRNIGCGRKTLKCDIFFDCFSSKSDTQFCNKYLKDALSEKGRILTNSNLIVENHPNIFACGDILEHVKNRGFAFAAKSGDIVAQNVLYSLGLLAKQKQYTGTFFYPAVVPIGTTHGIAYFPVFGGIVLGPWVARLKGKGLLKSRIERVIL